MIGLTRRLTLQALAAAAGAALTGGALAAPTVSAPAPVFTAVDTKGRNVDLAALRGKTVVLEWTNHDCPFVVKHYGAGNMQALQKEAADQGVVWITIISSAPGTQGHVDADTAEGLSASRDAAPSHIVLDPDGAIGRMFAAKTTPHMYVIDPDGMLVFAGGIDDKPSANPADIPGAKNYVRAALADLAAGRSVATPTSRPYGCSVKYAS